MPVVTMRELLECGVHFGHQTKRCHPKMKQYIFTARNDIHVIDLQKTLKLIEKTYQIVKDRVSKDAIVLFVGTKKQAQEAIQTEAARCGMYYVNQRWLGGLLTNFITIQKSIFKLKQFEKMKESGIIEKLTKKESYKKEKAYNQLKQILEGIKTMPRLPDLLVVVDTQKEQLAIKEARKLNIPIVGIVDTNVDPREVQFPIPANDDAIRAVKLICSIMANAVLDGKKGKEGSLNEEIAVEEESFDFKEEVLSNLEIEEIFEEEIEEVDVVKTKKNELKKMPKKVEEA
ncbi:MAG: 30S ribosomal protein S2 [Candidatus Margulisiibacteriota bacterium]|jgi:small subunit ribosomal protein S2